MFNIRGRELIRTTALVPTTAVSRMLPSWSGELDGFGGSAAPNQESRAARCMLRVPVVLGIAVSLVLGFETGPSASVLRISTSTDIHGFISL